MIRDSLNAGAANALIAVTPGNGITFQYRASDGGNCNNATTSGSAPEWVKLTGSGTTFTGYYSANGTTWTQVGSTTLTNITTAYIGLAVTSHNNPALCTARFDNVSGPGWTTSNLSPPLSVSMGGPNLTLSWPVASDLSLQSTTNLASGIWVNVTTTGQQIVGTNYQVTLPATNAAQFFRLSN
jgi:hypothetical protein